MLTARKLQGLLEFKGRLDAWVDRGRESGPFYGVDDPRYDDPEEVVQGEDLVEAALNALPVLRSEYVEQLLAQQGSASLVQRLRFVDSVVRNPSHI